MAKDPRCSAAKRMPGRFPLNDDLWKEAPNKLRRWIAAWLDEQDRMGTGGAAVL